MCGVSEAAGRSHDSDPLYYAIISYSRRNGAQRRSWSIRRSFLAPGLIVRTSLFLSGLTGYYYIFAVSPICLLLFANVANIEELELFEAFLCDSYIANFFCDTSIFICHCVYIVYLWIYFEYLWICHVYSECTFVFKMQFFYAAIDL